MMFLFFFIATALAIDDIARIVVGALKRKHKIYLDTVGEKDFRSRLSSEVRRNLPPETERQEQD